MAQPSPIQYLHPSAGSVTPLPVSLPVTSSSSGGNAPPVQYTPIITPTVVISSSSGPTSTALSVPMHGQWSAPPTELESTLAHKVEALTDVPVAPGNGNGNGTALAAAGNGNNRLIWLGAIALGILLLARK